MVRPNNHLDLLVLHDLAGMWFHNGKQSRNIVAGCGTLRIGWKGVSAIAVDYIGSPRRAGVEHLLQLPQGG